MDICVCEPIFPSYFYSIKRISVRLLFIIILSGETHTQSRNNSKLCHNIAPNKPVECIFTIMEYLRKYDNIQDDYRYGK